MKRNLLILLFGIVTSLFSGQPAVAQADRKLLFAGADLLHGVGRYNALRVGGGLSARVQYPLRSNLALTAKVGVEYYRIRYYDYLPGYSYLGYGYNIITGYGFNTIYYGAGYGYLVNDNGVSLPVTVGPRLYLPGLVRGLHTDLNAGLDVAATRTLITSLHIAPGVGYAVLLSTGNYLDVSLNYGTSFGRGSGVFGLSAAYGLPLGR